MAFTTGLITSPAPATGWLLGNVATPDWANLVSGNINDYVGIRASILGGTISVAGITVDGVGGNTVTANAGVSRNFWIPASGMVSSGGASTFTSGQYWTLNNAASSLIQAAVVLPYKNATFAATITAVSVRCNPASSAGFQLDLIKAINLSTTSAPVFSSVGSNTASSTGEQTVAVSGLSETMTSDKVYYIKATASSAPGDKLYAMNVTYTIQIF